MYFMFRAMLCQKKIMQYHQRTPSCSDRRKRQDAGDQHSLHQTASGSLMQIGKSKPTDTISVLHMPSIIYTHMHWHAPMHNNISDTIEKQTTPPDYAFLGHNPPGTPQAFKLDIGVKMSAQDPLSLPGTVFARNKCRVLTWYTFRSGSDVRSAGTAACSAECCWL